MPVWLQIILSLGGSTIVSLIVTSIWQKIVSAHQKQKEYEIEAKHQMEQTRNEQLSNNILAELKTKLDPLQGSINSLVHESQLQHEATILSLRANMLTVLNLYRHNGYADKHEKATWNEIYDQYRKEGGNYFKVYVDAWKDEVNSMPEKKGE